MAIRIRGTDHEESLNKEMGLAFDDLSHPWWPGGDGHARDAVGLFMALEAGRWLLQPLGGHRGPVGSVPHRDRQVATGKLGMKTDPNHSL